MSIYPLTILTNYILETMPRLTLLVLMSAVFSVITSTSAYASTEEGEVSYPEENDNDPEEEAEEAAEEG
jgi:hypothetical protein